MEAGRSDDNLRELIEKESERKQENERETVPVEELRGDRTVVFPSHTWEPRTDTGVKPYEGVTEPEILTRDEWPHPNSLWKPIVWYWRTTQWKCDVNSAKKMKLVSEASAHPGSTWPSTSEPRPWKESQRWGEPKVKRLWHHWQEHFTWLREECFRDVSTEKNTKK